MGKLKVENLVFKGEFDLPFCIGSVTNVNFDVKGTDEELTEIVNDLQTKIKDNRKFLEDMSLYTAVKYASESIFMEDLIDYMSLGDRDETFSSENMQALEEYAQSVNLKAGYKNYSGDVEAFIVKQFGNIDLGLITWDFDIESITIREDGGFALYPEPCEAEYLEEFDCYDIHLSEEIWQGDYIEFDSNLVGGATSH